ncbi:hypothetical protein PIROE2DRAFT_57928 [Piromyces sp. E2]|nr:hypothetical protein PIROE2DRAFT_57928 [Piromyces sp. E2]|eukprot:OUM68718.1 hypothetical protein PIROE2DRAFT_57928 [Piromyces sp. E2]
MDECNKSKKFLDNLNLTSSSILNTSMDEAKENYQDNSSHKILPNSCVAHDTNFNMISSFNLSLRNFSNNNSSKLDDMDSLSFYSPNSVDTPLQLTPVISNPIFNSSHLLNHDSNSSDVTNVTSTSFNLTTTILSPTFSSPGYDGSLPSPCTSPYPCDKYSDNFIPVCQGPNIQSNFISDNHLQPVMSSTSSSSPKESQNLHNFMNNLQTSFTNPELYYQNQDVSFNSVNPIQVENSYNIVTKTATPYRSILSNPINPFIINQDFSSLNNYNNGFKNPFITPNTNPRKNDNNVSSNYFPKNMNTIDPTIHADNSPFLSPLANINNKHQLNKNSSFVSVYSQIFSDNLKQTTDSNTQEENENMINQYFNLNSNPSLISSNQSISVPENYDSTLVEGNKNDLNYSDIINPNPLSLPSNNEIISDGDPLKSSLKNVFQKNYAKNDDINQFLFSDSFLTSISNNDEINLINNGDSVIDYNNSNNISNKTIKMMDNGEGGEENNDNDLNLVNPLEDETTFKSIVKEKSAFLENLNKELEDSLYNQFEKTNNVDNNDLLLSSSPFNSSSFLNSDENIFQDILLSDNNSNKEFSSNNINIKEEKTKEVSNKLDNSSDNDNEKTESKKKIILKIGKNPFTNWKNNFHKNIYRNLVENFLRSCANEITIVLSHSKVAQKSYGSEKRFFCPPPSCRLYGNLWNFFNLNDTDISISNNDNQNSDLFSPFVLPKLYLSLMSEQEFNQQNNTDNKNINQQNFSICGNLIIEPTRTSLKKVIQRNELREVEQNFKSVSDFDISKRKTNNNPLNSVINNTQILRKSKFLFNDSLKKETDLNIETIGKCLFKQLFISDSDKRKYFTIFVKIVSANGTHFGTFESKPVKIISKPSKKKQSVKNIDYTVDRKKQENEAYIQLQRKNYEQNYNPDTYIGDPLSQLHKVAFQVKEDPSLYLCAVNEKIGWIRGFGVKKVSSKKKKMDDIRVYEDIPESAVWTIVGTEHVKYSFILPVNNDDKESKSESFDYSINKNIINKEEKNYKRRKLDKSISSLTCKI